MNMSVTAARIQALAQGGAGAWAPQQQQQQQRLAAPMQSQFSASTTEDALARQLSALGPARGNVPIERMRDGLKIGNTAFLDPEGQVRTYGFDVMTGDVSYSVRNGDALVYKYLRAGSSGDPVPFASARQDGAGWQVSTVTGKNFSGDSVIPLAKGVMVARAGSVFLYEPGKGSRSAVVPDGWNLAQFQRGNVGATRYVMLERSKPASEGKGTVGAFVSSLRSLGAVAGVNRKEDFALMNLETGQMHPLNIQSSGKNQAVMSNCQRRNALVNDCATMNFYESLYTDIGRNFGHYFWKADWYATPSGPLAITMENGVADVYALDLASGKKVTVFHRALGITSVDSHQASDGTVGITAKWMFEDHKVADAAAFLRDNPALGAAPVSGSGSSGTPRP